MRKTFAVLAAAALLSGAASMSVPASASADRPEGLPGHFKHLVVIYEENHSFDNLYGGWGSVAGEQVDDLTTVPPTAATQVAQDGTPYSCLKQVDVNLTSPVPLPATCTDPNPLVGPSHFGNEPFLIDDYIRPTDTTCPAPGSSPRNGVRNGFGLPGGCTRDLVHRFYQNQYQIDGGRQDRYVTGSDAVGLSMGRYDTTQLPIYRYLHAHGAPHYVVADHFFQAAFGGSFLNHQWLIAARTPYVDPTGTIPEGRLPARSSVVDQAGMPVNDYPLYQTTEPVVDGEKTVACADPATDDYQDACGNYAVNTTQPAVPPYAAGAGARFMPLIDDAAYPNIGDRMSAKDISWAWYSGKWDDANAGLPVPVFQYHHQPFNYFAAYAPGQPGRAHLRDESEFLTAVENGTLPTVSFVKPYGTENEHPGYASEPNGSDRLVDLLKAVTEGPQAGNTLVVVTYDEFGGQWDHVPPPAAGAPAGTTDVWGPGTRIPALLVARSLTRSGVDHTVYDTTSILATIERSFGLEPLSTRDAAVNDLSNAVHVGGR